MNARYDEIGQSNRRARVPDPRIAAVIEPAQAGHVTLRSDLDDGM